MLFDYIGDIHLDFWVKLEHNPVKMRKNIYQFVQSILPDHPSDTLFIAGDFGHYNQQSYWLIYYLKEVYETIFFVCGNHDYYLLTKNIKKKYGSSAKRIDEFVNKASLLEGVYRLDGEVYEHKGILIGGADMWYDFSYGLKRLGLPYQHVYEKWWNKSRDSRCHSGLLPTLEHANREKEKVKGMICDIFISHVPPLSAPIEVDYMEEDIEMLSFYLFDDSNIFCEKKPLIWLSGHIHQKMNKTVDGLRYLSQAIGYKDTEKGIIVPERIQTFDMSKL